jgi:hypothetical protein
MRKDYDPGSLVIRNTSGADRTMAMYGGYVFVKDLPFELVDNGTAMSAGAHDTAKNMVGHASKTKPPRNTACELAAMIAAGDAEILSERPAALIYVEDES